MPYLEPLELLPGLRQFTELIASSTEAGQCCQLPHCCQEAGCVIQHGGSVLQLKLLQAAGQAGKARHSMAPGLVVVEGQAEVG